MKQLKNIFIIFFESKYVYQILKKKVFYSLKRKECE